MSVSISRPYDFAPARQAPRPRVPTWLQTQARRCAISTQLHKRFYKHLLGSALGLISAPAATGDPADGITFVLPGIEAESAYTYGMCDGLRSARLAGRIEVFNWALPFPVGFLNNLVRVDRNRRRGLDLARQIVNYQDQYPNRPVNLLAHSGGGGVAVFALEALPEGRSVQSLAILAGALSPTYDLTRALARTTRGILNSYSEKDWVVGLGTRLFGTTDRQFSPACGAVGFTPPASTSLSKSLYSKLTQLAWHPTMECDCVHWGTHATSAKEEFISRHIAPWLAQ